MLVQGLDDASANAAMSAAMGSSCDVSAAAHLPRNVVMHFAGLYVDQAATVFRLEGVAPSVQHRKDALIDLLRAVRCAGDDRRGEFAQALAQRPRRHAVLGTTARSGDWPLWRISTAPARGPEFASKLPPGAQLFYDWAGGLIWMRCRRRPMPARPPSAAPRLRPAAMPRSSARRPRCAPSVDVFEPQKGALAGVSKRVKESFDPKGVLNPGRMWAGV